jgi:signal transduction histidine kinase
MLGVPRQGLCGRRIDEFLDRDVALGIPQHWRAFLDEGEDKGEWRLIALDKRRFIVEYSAKAHIAAGRHLHIWRDVTRKKQLEDQLLQSQKMETVGRLAGGVAHDFNNLITAIMGYAESVALRVTGPVRDDVQEIVRASEKAASLTSRLLTFSRKRIAQRNVVRLNRIVSSSGKMLSRLLGDNIELRVDAAPDLWFTRVDPTQIEHVILNLVVNARDAMPSGGRITIELANADAANRNRTEDIDVPDGEYVRLSVTDSGTGMDDVIKAHLFEPFFTTKDRGKGTGLGLAMVYAIVQQSDGHIRVDTIPGVGSTFRIYLPRTEAPAEEEPIVNTARPAHGSETILVAEDEPSVRSLVRSTLERHGYRVLEARDGGEALSVARNHSGRIDLLLTDVMMPVLDGRELATALRADCDNLLVIYMSGYVDDVIHPTEWRTGAFFQKPFTASALTQVVRDVLDGRVRATAS